MTNRNPIYDPDRGFRFWALAEIYDGMNGKYIPNVNDAVWDWDNGLYRVIAIDVETGLSTLERHSLVPSNPAISPDDILLGAAPGRASETFRLYVNDKTDPITAVAESRLFLYGSDNEYIRYFKGFDISENGEVISLYYDDDNILRDDKIPLELVYVPDGENRAIKTPSPGYVSTALDDGEVVTCVVYGSAGTTSSVNPLLVKNTSYIRGMNFANKYITHISINSPFLIDETESKLEVPLHTPIEDINITINVHYSDGTSRKVVPDGKKSVVEGLETFTQSQSGRVVPISVIYIFSDGEANYSSNADKGRSITKVYHITTLNPEEAGVVKLFVIPKWDGEILGWGLNYYLYNLHRSLTLNVNEHVRVIEPPDRGYDPRDYGNLQVLRLSVDIGEIEEISATYTHTQYFNITLFSPINEIIPSWTFTYSDTGDIVYGEVQIARVNNISSDVTVDISQNISDIKTWLDLMYVPLYPLTEVDSVSTILPTHLTLIYGNSELEVSVEDVLKPILFQIAPRAGDTLELKWINRIESRDLELAISPLTIVND